MNLVKGIIFARTTFIDLSLTTTVCLLQLLQLVLRVFLGDKQVKFAEDDWHFSLYCYTEWSKCYASGLLFTVAVFIHVTLGFFYDFVKNYSTVVKIAMKILNMKLFPVWDSERFVEPHHSAVQSGGKSWNHSKLSQSILFCTITIHQVWWLK